MTVPEGQRRTVAVKLRLPPIAAAALRVLAEKHGVSVSEVVARMVAPSLTPPKTKVARSEAKRERERVFVEWLSSATAAEIRQRLTACDDPAWMQTAMDRRERAVRALAAPEGSVER